MWSWDREEQILGTLRTWWLGKGEGKGGRLLGLIVHFLWDTQGPIPEQLVRGSCTEQEDCPDVLGDQTHPVWANLAQYFIAWRLSAFSSSVECLGVRIGCDIWNGTWDANILPCSFPYWFHTKRLSFGGTF